jgi:hypothetical protein
MREYYWPTLAPKKEYIPVPPAPRPAPAAPPARDTSWVNDLSEAERATEIANIVAQNPDDWKMGGQRVQTIGKHDFILEHEAAKQEGEPYGPSAVRPNSAHQRKSKEREAAQAEGSQETKDAWEYLVKSYPNHICERWKQYALFFQDMGSKPDGKSLTRYRDSGMFEKGNCQWMTKKQAAFERKRRVENKVLPEINDLDGNKSEIWVSS